MEPDGEQPHSTPNHFLNYDLGSTEFFLSFSPNPFYTDVVTGTAFTVTP
jgi:hypothetical protein